MFTWIIIALTLIGVSGLTYWSVRSGNTFLAFFAWISVPALGLGIWALACYYPTLTHGTIDTDSVITQQGTYTIEQVTYERSNPWLTPWSYTNGGYTRVSTTQ